MVRIDLERIARVNVGHIIICDGRIDAAVARNGAEMIQAASHCATATVTHYGDRLTTIDTLPISDLQH